MAKKESFRELPVIAYATLSRWLAWLEKNHQRDAGIWIKLAKKNRGIRTISYEEAREGALMYGWIDGQIQRWDEDYYLIRCTPRRPASKWSKINREIATGLIRQKKMQPSGMAQVKKARADGRWEAAYDSASTMKVPAELQKLLNRNATARKNFEQLDSANRYAFLYRIQGAKREETRKKHIDRAFEMLKADEVYLPDRRKKSVKKKATTKKKAGRVGDSKVTTSKAATRQAATKKAVTKKMAAKPKKATNRSAHSWIALLRGVNVAGKNKIKMAELREVLSAAGFNNVSTYIQSGNILFTATGTARKLEETVHQQIAKHFGYDVPVLVRPTKFFADIVKHCPYAAEDTQFVHATILKATPKKSLLTSIQKLDFGSDSFRVRKDVVYVCCPNGYGKTRLNNQFFESKLEQPATTRNWKSINKLIELSD